MQILTTMHNRSYTAKDNLLSINNSTTTGFTATSRLIWLRNDY
ncbi:MAG: hypothetical protein ACFFCZ_08755 [Promethearchaeota archaeon]